MFDDKQKLARDLNRDGASFLWFQMLVGVLKAFPQDTLEKREMLDTCRHEYKHNGEETKIIEEFDSTYHSSQAVWWYTKECFLYRLVNKALRQENINLLRIYRFFIVDLCNQLEEEHRKRIVADSANNGRVIDLYRGQQLSRTEIDKLKSNTGSLISTNGFFSTTTKREVAISFANPRKTERLDIVQVLFEIQARSCLEFVIFADVKDLSAIKDENEYLFSIGAVFLIESVIFDNNESIWIIKMTATDQGAKNRKDYIEQTRVDVEETSESILFGRLLIDMGQYEDAEIYYESMLSKMSEANVNIADLYHNLGRARGYKGDLQKALHYFSLARNSRKGNEQNNPAVARILNSTGIIYGEQGNYEKAMITFNEALNIQQIYQSSVSNNQAAAQSRNVSLNIAITRSNTGWGYYLRSEYEKAKIEHNKALDIRRQFLPNEHPLIADYYSSIGTIAHAQGNYEEAQRNYNKALEIRMRTLPENHPRTVDSFQLLGELEYANGKYDRALEQFDNVRQMRISTFGSNHLSLASIYKSTGYVHLDCGRHDEAINNFNSALAICKKNLPETHPAFGDCYHLFALVEEKRGNYAVALEWCKKAHQNISAGLPKQHRFIAKILITMGNIQIRQKKYQFALTMYNNALQIQEKSFSNGQHPDIALTLSNIGSLHTLLQDFQSAKTNLDKALTICGNCFRSSHPSKARVLYNIGGMYKEMENLPESLKNFEAALDNLENTLPSNHLSTADTCYKLGWVSFELYDFTNALYYFEKCSNIYESLQTQHVQIVNEHDVRIARESIDIVRYELGIE
ncbi:unnamed protein product [Rotaria socialis]|uniref:Uncharacterized protein n=1 Tax=Rotaria socialis TaxID=392032 RepID=A0A820TUW6_9BILA|nr:unnamed protein product [Rotaria socialis]CAF4472358.1 unnamed protein product [Rotaria socialis]